MAEQNKDKIYDYYPLFGSWEIGRRLGRGGYGSVYEVYKTDMGITQLSAVKLIEPRNESEFKYVVAEIEAMRQMHGELNVVRIEDFKEVERKHYEGKDILIRMELLTSLDSVINERNLSVAEVTKLGVDICRALEVCGEYDIIHRDIKPANILISKRGDYKLGDFGIARACSNATMTAVGTMTYMAPEVARGRYDKRADIYSLGLTMYALLNGNRLPFEGEDSEESPIVRRLDGEALPELKGVKIGLQRVVLKACAYNREDRYASGSEMRKALETADRGVDDIMETRRDVVINDSSRPPIGSAYKFAGIDWRVLDIQGNKALLISKEVLEKRPYNDEYKDITWEKCTLRGYLNGEFYNKLGAAKSAIAETRNANPNNPWYGTTGGNATIDKVFLLSLEEVCSYFGNSAASLKEKGIEGNDY